MSLRPSLPRGDHSGMRFFTVWLLLVLLSQPVLAAEFGGYVTLTSDYVKRGVTQSDGHGAVQLGVDASFDNGIFFGAWGSTADIHNGPTRHRDMELNLYVGYQLEATQKWQVGASVVAYDYPGQTGDVDYAYIEYLLSANYDDRFWLEYAYSPDLYHTGRDSHNIEALAEFGLSQSWAVSGGIGVYDVSDLAGDRYSYWQLGATWRLRNADIDLRFHDSSKPVFIVSTPERAKARVAVSVIIPF